MENQGVVTEVPVRSNTTKFYTTVDFRSSGFKQDTPDKMTLNVIIIIYTNELVASRCKVDEDPEIEARQHTQNIERRREQRVPGLEHAGRSIREDDATERLTIVYRPGPGTRWEGG